MGRQRSHLSRRGLLAGFVGSSLLLAGCQTLQSAIGLATPTPTEPRRARVVAPSPGGFLVPNSTLARIANRIAPERHIRVETMPIDLRGIPPEEVPARYAAIVGTLSTTDVPDLVLLPWQAVNPLAQANVLQDLTPLLKAERWFKPDDYVGNALRTGQVRGRMVALPLETGVEFLLYNRRTFQEFGVPPPTPGWGWDQLLVTARALTPPRREGRGARWGFFIDSVSPSFLTVAWQHGAQVISDDGSRIDLTEPGTVQAMQLLVDLIHRHEVAPPLDERAQRSLTLDRQWQVLTRQEAAMATSFASGSVWWRREEILTSELPTIAHPAGFGVVTTAVGIPRGAPNIAHSLNALRAIADASAQAMVLPARRDLADLRQVDGMLTANDANVLSRALDSARFLPGDLPFEMLPFLLQGYVFPVLAGQKQPLRAGQEAQVLIEQMLRRQSP